MKRIWTAATLAVCGLLAAGRAGPRAATREDHARWLDRDVAYLITDDERAAFTALRTLAEKDAFVEQFWARRNPRPASRDSPARTEHYRRLRHADAAFATRSAPEGWRSDRGRIYIVYGAPRRVGHDPRSPGVERWWYAVGSPASEIELVFTRSALDGDYHLTEMIVRTRIPTVVDQRTNQRMA